MDIYLIRHGETDWNKAHRFQGRTDVPLNDFGRQLAVLTRVGMPPMAWDYVFASPLCRARETARILLEGSATSAAVVTDDRLVEFGFGPYEGADITEAARDASHPLYDCLHHPERYAPPAGAESFEALVSRARSFLVECIQPLEDVAPSGNVLVVAHGALIRAAIVAVGRKSIADFWGVPYYNCCVSRLSLSGGQFNVEDEARVYYDVAEASRGWKK